MGTLINMLIQELTYIPNILMLLISIGLLWLMYQFNTFNKNFECRIKEATKKQYLMILRLMIISDEVPLKDKLECYDEYKGLGGNSWVDNYVNQVVIPKLAGTTPQRRKEDTETSE